MNLVKQSIEGLFLLQPDVFRDERGTFRRNFCLKELHNAGIQFNACQGNISENAAKYTLRGFHYQKSPSSEAKILTPVVGGIYNVVIDLRRASATFLKHSIVELTSSKKESLLVPAGCANAFLTLEPNTIIQYYMGDYFKPESYAGFRYNESFFNISWPTAPVVISERDAGHPDFSLDSI